MAQRLGSSHREYPPNQAQTCPRSLELYEEIIQQSQVFRADRSQGEAQSIRVYQP